MTGICHSHQLVCLKWPLEGTPPRLLPLCFGLYFPLPFARTVMPHCFQLCHQSIQLTIYTMFSQLLFVQVLYVILFLLSGFCCACVFWIILCFCLLPCQITVFGPCIKAALGSAILSQSFPLHYIHLHSNYACTVYGIHAVTMKRFNLIK